MKNGLNDSLRIQERQFRKQFACLRIQRILRKRPHFLPVELCINLHDLTFCQGSHAQTCTTPLFVREALHKRARPHFLSGKLCTNVHGLTFCQWSHGRCATAPLFVGEVMGVAPWPHFLPGESWEMRHGPLPFGRPVVKPPRLHRI